MSVILDTHFAERFEHRHGFKTPSTVETNKLLTQTVKQGIDEVLAGDEDAASIVLKTKRTHLHVVAKLRRFKSRPPEIRIYAKTVIVKADFVPSSPRDRIYTENPARVIKFSYGRYPSELKELVIEDLLPLIDGLKDDTAYHLPKMENGFDYVVEVDGPVVSVVYAGWELPVYIIND